MQASAFTNPMASVCLSVLQIHIWLSKLICWPPQCGLCASHQRTVSHPLQDHLGDIVAGNYEWCPVRRVPRKPAAPQGCRVLPLPMLSPSCVNEGNWCVFSTALRGALASTWWPALLQFMSVEALGDSVKRTKSPWETRRCGTAMGMVCLLASQQLFTFGQIDLTIPIYPNLLQLKMISFFWAVKTAEIAQ